jgi:23S rRNA (uracil1939-C5)-methyltransferase
VRLLSAHAERSLPGLEGVDLVVVDPPRSGLGDVVTSTLARTQPARIIYVSCAPPSQVRDMVALCEAGYRVRSLELFDFYPQTFHVESLAVLER